MRLAARTDSNGNDVINAFRKLGCGVVSAHRMGCGFPDLVVSQRSRTDGVGSITYLVEIKDGAKSPSRRKLTDDQVEFHAHWPGRIFTVLSVDDVPGVIRAAAMED
jgi:hypothetical protein